MLAFGRRLIDYMSNNGAQIASTAVVAAGWTGAAVAGGPKIITGICLVGGGMMATLVAHELTTGLIKVGGAAIRGMREGIRKGLEPKQQRPQGTGQHIATS